MTVRNWLNPNLPLEEPEGRRQLNDVLDELARGINSVDLESLAPDVLSRISLQPASGYAGRAGGITVTGGGNIEYGIAWAPSGIGGYASFTNFGATLVNSTFTSPDGTFEEGSVSLVNTGVGTPYVLPVEVHARLPDNFTGWKPAAIRIHEKFSSSSFNGSAIGKCVVSSPVAGLPDVVSKTHWTEVSAGPGGTFTKERIITKKELEDGTPGWKGGYGLKLRIELTLPAVASDFTWDLGLLELNWE